MAVDWIKDPDAVLDWHWDWSEWLADGELILTSTVTTSAGINIDSSAFTLYTATAWLSGGTPGQIYSISDKITTNLGRTDERSIVIRIQNR